LKDSRQECVEISFGYRQPGSENLLLQRQGVSHYPGCAPGFSQMKIEQYLGSKSIGKRGSYAQSPRKETAMRANSRTTGKSPQLLQTDQLLPRECGKCSIDRKKCETIPGKEFLRLMPVAWLRSLKESRPLPERFFGNLSVKSTAPHSEAERERVHLADMKPFGSVDETPEIPSLLDTVKLPAASD
jgi:hypothetical protein